MTDLTAPASEKAVAPLRVGVLGCGALGLVHAQRLSEIPNVFIHAVSDPDETSMRRVIEVVAPPASGDIPAFADYRAMLDKTELDAVVISSPNKWHVEQILASLEHNLHVLCEKPLSMNPAEVEQVVQATHAAKRIVAIAYQSRYRTNARFLHNLLHSGKTGKVKSVSIFSCEDWITPNVGTWRHDPARCPGGFFADANGHQLDLLFWLTGLEPVWARATTETRGTPVPMVTWGEARLRQQKAEGRRQEAEGVEQEPDSSLIPHPSSLPDNVPLSFMFAGDARHWSEEIRIQTEQCDFVIRNGQLLWTDGHAQMAPFPESEMDAAIRRLPDLPDTAFVEAVRGGSPIVSPPETVWPVLRFTRAALASAHQGGQPQSATEQS